MNSIEREIFAEQIVVVTVPVCGRKVDPMWHVPHIIASIGISLSALVYNFKDH